MISSFDMCFLDQRRSTENSLRGSIHIKASMRNSLVRLSPTTLILFSLLQMEPFCYMVSEVDTTQGPAAFCIWEGEGATEGSCPSVWRN